MDLFAIDLMFIRALLRVFSLSKIVSFEKSIEQNTIWAFFWDDGAMILCNLIIFSRKQSAMKTEINYKLA